MENTLKIFGKVNNLFDCFGVSQHFTKIASERLDYDISDNLSIVGEIFVA